MRLTRLLDRAWAIKADVLDTLASLAEQSYDAAKVNLSAIQPASLTEVVGDSGVLSVAGVLTMRPGVIERVLLGAIDTEELSRAFDSLEQNPNVKRIILRLDSPGGEVAGVGELANKIAKSSKPTIAFSDTQMTSGAQWLASAADRVIATPSTEVGSIGVVFAHVAREGALANGGLKLTVIRSGDLKAPGYLGSNITSAQHEHLRNQVANAFQMFSGFVKKQRPNIDQSVFDGRSVFAEQGVKLGLVDSLHDSFDAVLANAAKLTSSKRSGGAGAVDDTKDEWNANADLREEFLDDFGAYKAYRAASRGGRAVVYGSKSEVPKFNEDEFDYPAMFEASVQLQEEFGNVEAYTAYSKAAAEGRAIIHKRTSLAV